MVRNVALIILDTVRQDHFQKYANRLQSRSDVMFTQCRAASSCTVPSHASILTGKLPHEHGIHSTAVDYSDLNEESTFFGDIPDQHAIGVSTNTFAGSSFGFEGLFDDFVDVSWTRRFPNGLDSREFVSKTEAEGLAFYREFLETALRHDNTLATLSNAALAKLNVFISNLPLPNILDDGSSAALKAARERMRVGTEPFFLFVNLMEAHTPHQSRLGYDRSLYDVPNGWNSMEGLNQWEVNRNGMAAHEEAVKYYRKLYVAAIDYLDRHVAKFIDQVQTETENDTTFVITSDHGENLGFEADEEMVGHTSSLSEGVLHVPLTIVNPPAGYSPTERGLVSQLELGTIITGLAKDRTPNVSSERIAAERITTTNTPDVDPDEQRYWNRMLRCVYEGEKKWIWDSLGDCTAYNLDFERPNWQQKRTDSDPAPPDWREDHFPEIMEAFQRRDGDIATGNIDAATRSRLEELGYL